MCVEIIYLLSHEFVPKTYYEHLGVYMILTFCHISPKKYLKGQLSLILAVPSIVMLMLTSLKSLLVPNIPSANTRNQYLPSLNCVLCLTKLMLQPLSDSTD